MTMFIENYTGTADKFTFPYNPLSFDSSLSSNNQKQNLAFQRHNIVSSGGGVTPATLVLTGHFSGTDRWTNYRLLGKHFGENYKLKKLYFESDKFYLGLGQSLKKTHVSERTNFIDYVFSFDCIIGILFGNTQKTSGTNDGNTITYVEEITFTVTDGAVDVVLEDAVSSKLTIDNSALSTGMSIKYELVSMVDSGGGVYISEYGKIYKDVAGEWVRITNVTTDNGFGLLQVGIGANITTVTVSNASSIVRKFRDGYVD